MRLNTHRQLWMFLAGFFLQATPGMMLTTVVTLSMATRGVDAVVIGALSTIGSVAYIAALPAAPALIRRFGAATTQRLALALRMATVLGLATTEAPALIALAYAVLGFAAGLTFTIAETWVPALASRGQSGRALAIYQTVVGASSFVGAGLVLLAGVEGPLPRVIAVAAMFLGMVTLWRIDAPAGDEPAAASTSLITGSPASSLRRMLAQAGAAVLAVALIGGIFESGLAVALPLYSLAVGAGPTLAAGLATALGLGSLMQYPYGALADRWPWRRVAIITAAAVAASALLLPLAPGWPWLLLPLGVVWGSAGGGLYTLATIRNAARYRSDRLVNASVVTQLAYMIGEAAGPAASGLAIDLAPRYGLPLLVGSVALLGLLTIVGAAGWSHRAADGAEAPRSEPGSAASAAL